MSAAVHTSVTDFGTALLNSGDLDPIYEMLRAAALGSELRNRWMLAYWFFYHAGVASWIADSSDFYTAALYAFDNKLPRGAERRHFRGAVPRNAVLWFRDNFPEPEGVAESVYAPTFAECRARVLELPLFGPWIAFKVADMLERVAGLEMDFDGCDLFMYEQPTKSAVMVHSELGLRPGSTEQRVKMVVEYLLAYYQNRKAPPAFDRAIGVQEVETILCKYKSHRNGHYPIGKDRREIKHGLISWGPLAERLGKSL